MAVSTEDNWEGWLKFFLKGIFEVSESATTTAHSILNLREQHRELIGREINNSGYGSRLLDLLFEKPIVNIPLVQEYLE